MLSALSILGAFGFPIELKPILISALGIFIVALDLLASAVELSFAGGVGFAGIGAFTSIGFFGL